MAKEAHHERVCTFLVAGDKTPASGNEIRAALESSDDEAKVEAMEKAISALLAGEQLPALFITMVRYVLPSENHTVQKLLLLYLETIQKHDAKGTLLPEMILICQNLRNNLQHPNEYVRGVTLRFLTRLQERELLEPLIPSVLSNLDHRHSYVRRYAVLALASIATRPFGEADVPDAPELLEKVLDSEQDAGTRRNAFRALAALSPQRASAFLFARADSAPAWPDSFATEALALLR
ncbi:adaptin, partial [Helicosporidium sp. ATCC 50920]